MIRVGQQVKFPLDTAWADRSDNRGVVLAIHGECAWVLWDGYVSPITYHVSQVVPA